MTWNYQILRNSDGSYALHEVYCDDTGRANGTTMRPVSFVADAEEGTKGIVASLEMALRDARTRDVIDMEYFETQSRLVGHPSDLPDDIIDALEKSVEDPKPD